MRKLLKVEIAIFMIVLLYMSITFGIRAIQDFFSLGDNDFVVNIIVAGASILVLIFSIEPCMKIWRDEPWK